MITPKLTSQKGKAVVTIPPGLEALGEKWAPKSHIFDNFDEATALIAECVTAQATAKAPKAEISFKRTYRNEFQVIGPDGFPVMTLTRDKVQWLNDNLPTINATFATVVGQIAESYDKRPKSLPKGDPKISEGKVTIPTVVPAKA